LYFSPAWFFFARDLGNLFAYSDYYNGNFFKAKNMKTYITFYNNVVTDQVTRKTILITEQPYKHFSLHEKMGVKHLYTFWAYECHIAPTFIYQLQQAWQKRCIIQGDELLMHIEGDKWNVVCKVTFVL
jgi:hypothetical protein